MFKTCFKCKLNLSLDNFYKHPQMPDGTVNKCKECNKKDVSLNYRKNIVHYAKYEKFRGHHSGPPKNTKEYRRKQNIRQQTRRGILSGKIQEKNYCERCNAKDVKIEIHHLDYELPLNFKFVCRPCHMWFHGKNSYEEVLKNE